MQTACGKSAAVPPEAGPDDAAPEAFDAAADGVPDAAADAAPLPPACAAPVAGTTVTMPKLAAKVDGIATLVTAAPGDPPLFCVATGRSRANVPATPQVGR